MGSTTNQVTLIFADGHVEEFPVLPKGEVASRILDRVMTLPNRHE
jgi:prepilin-type processing-associated H-X9-DG protein